MHVSCSSHTWFIYNLNTSFYQLHSYNLHDTDTQINSTKLWRNPSLFPFQFPLLFPLILESLLLTWNPSFCVVRSRPLWSQVARELTSPSLFPPPFLPIPISRPPGVSPNNLCALLRRHHDPGFTQSGTLYTYTAASGKRHCAQLFYSHWLDLLL